MIAKFYNKFDDLHE
jgi:hypothetical protein